jgi:hypothetical protein
MEVDGSAALNAVALDIIGAAGFDYAFNSLSRSEDDPSELSDAFHNMQATTSRVTLWAVLAYFFPFMHLLVRDEARRDTINLTTLSQRRLTTR